MTEADTEFPRRGVDTDPRGIRRDGRDARSTTERNGRARTARSRFSRARAAATRETFALRSCAADAAGGNGAQLVGRYPAAATNPRVRPGTRTRHSLKIFYGSPVGRIQGARLI